MTEENTEKKYPSLVAAAYVFNGEGKIFLVTSPNWDNKLVIPGGHVEYGETTEEAAIREMKEETNLDITNLEFLKVEEIINSPEYSKKKNIVSITYKALLKDEDQEVILDKKEGTEYFWLTPEEAVKREDIQEDIRGCIKEYFLKKDKKKLFSKKCKNCEKTDEYKSGWARAQADYQNLVKETEKNRSEWAQYSERQILEEFIPVYDNFQLAFGHQPSDFSNEQSKWAEGIGFIMKQFSDVLKQHGVEEIETVGEEFNPELHEALSEEESEEVETGRILKQVSAGYRMRGKVIRVAKVVVAK